ncbi:uncharacterized protein LOC115245055 [Formica exsecta]|uniref:uncharacterized protein LOC115245055 n=1 Tax=Formica exsecta TaxID=72781 RepID=UPI0011449D3C|nr:uncharacterized protein LOC115245055 [Formica exsecta]
MNYSGNMPDWHQYNPSQSGINDVTSTAQNVNSGHLSFISSISPTCSTQLNSLNLSSEGFEKHQSDPNFNPRHFQPHLSSNISHGHNAAADNTPLASMVQMQNCIGHYGPSNTRNPMVDNSMDPRNAPIGGLNEELGYRNNQVPLNGPISHMNGPNVMNMNAPSHGSIGPRNTNVNSHAASRTAGPSGPPPSYVPCKGLCCNPDPNIGYQQWEKYCSYQNNATYRENIRSSAGYQADARRFNSDFNFRKDNFDGKEVLSPVVPPPNGPNVDHRRNFPDFKYRKDRLLTRNYPPSSGMLQNYPMQSYNYTGEYQKYSYNVKEYSKMSGMNVPNQGMVKHQEQSFAIPQQKYNSKQVSYQNNGGTMMQSSMPSATNVPNPNMIPSAQNTYFNSQYPRNLPTENTHDCQETATDNVSMVNRMQASTMHAPPPHPRYHIYQQKMAMQRFSMENHLRELMRIPGYQSHPKYKEYAHRYRELLKSQQSITYQGPIQQTPPCVTASTVNNTSTIPPINLQFDQNGVLINSNYIPEAFPRIQQAPPVNPQAPLNSLADKQAGKQDGNSIPEIANHNVQKPERLISQQHNNGGLTAAVLCSENVQKQDEYSAQKSLDQSQFEVQKTGSENFNNLNTNAGNTVIRQYPKKISKEFADKPELDVRQFLANWDESEDEDGSSNNLPNAILSNSTPVVVVGYENVNLSAKTLEDLNGSKSEEITSNVITFENQDKSGNIDVVPAQDCLTISYSAAENIEMAKDSTCKEIISKENVVRPGSHIIQCISNGPDEVPTIHIVDNLEIGSILQVANGQTVAETLERQEAVSFFREGTEVTASTITLEVDKKTDGESTSTEYNAETLSKDIIKGSSPSRTVEDTSQTSRINNPEMAATLPTSMKDNNLDTAQDMNLKKQSSFASEESHNPDDISLPDLPTSECTPISTTLNTPIHSDNEESSESHVDDLTISTNPIEIIQNSPMISFTQSPTNGEPYDHLSDERNKSSDSSENKYRAGNHFKNDRSNNMLDHDVLDTFEFSTNIDKNESTMIAKNGKEHANTNENSKNNNEKVFLLHDETENAEATDMRMTLTSASEYELKIMSTGMQQNKSTRNNKNSTITKRHANESQATSSAVSPDAPKQLLQETNAKTIRYANSMELNNIALQNITRDPDPIELDGGRDINYSEKRCMSTCQTITTNTISSLPTNDIAPKNSRSAVEDGCSTKIVKSNSSISHSTKHSILSSDKSRKCETFTGDKFAKEDSLLEKNANANKAVKIDEKNSKNSRHVTLMDHKKSISGNQTISRKKRCLSENTADKLCGETIIHHNKYTQEAATRKDKSRPVESFKESNISYNKPRVIDNVSIDDSGERMRLLKEYRRMKHKSSTLGLQNKNKDTQESFDTANEKLHSSPNPEEALQLPSNKQLYQKDVARLKSSEEQEKKRASILKTFVTKNINPDFAIQVTNVNLKLKDNDHQKESQHLEEEAKNSGPLDAIKIEINVSCTERNTTEKLLHENIKNAVAETIGHLTNSISNGVRSNSTSITEIQCDKKTACDKPADCRDYERRNRSPATLTETSTYTEVREDSINTEVVKHDAVNTACKENSNNDETSGSLKKRRGSLLEGKLINDIYEKKGNIDTEAEPESNVSEILKSEQAAIKRRNLHEESDRKVAAINFCSEELKTSSDNLPCVGSTSKNVSVQKKEHQEMTAASLCRNAKSFQDDIASRLNAIPSTSSSTVDPSLENVKYDNPVHFDYNHFDVAPNENADANAKRIDRWKRPKRDDGRFGNFDLCETASGYVNPNFFSADELENLNTVPVYTTKDGKITYSLNPRFTYRELIMEARANENYDNARESYFAKSPSYDYYNCSKLRKVFKRNRDVTSTTGRKGEISPADTKSASRHIDHLPNKNAVHKNSLCAKTSRNTSHLEFFNDDADKLYTSKSSQQESKENNKKNIVDLSFLEKQYNLDNETASSVKHCKTKVLTDNLAYEKEHGESSVFDSNLILAPRLPCWEETMESIKSYSSHIDRRNSDNLKELNFGEIFAAQKRLDSFPFLSTEQDSSDNSNRKTISTIANEPIIQRSTCDYTENLDSIWDNDSQCEQLNIAPHNKKENECNNQNDTLATDVNNKSANILNTSLNIQRNDEYTKKQEFQSDEIKCNNLFIEREQSPPKVADEKTHDSEKNQCSTNYVKDEEILTRSHLMEDATHVCCIPASPKEDKSNANEDANAKHISNESCVEVASPFKLCVESKNMLDESKCTETVKDSALTSNKQGEINDSVKDNSESAISQEIVHQQDSLALIDRKDSEKVAPVIGSNISTEIDFNQTNSQNDEENSTVCKLNEPIISQNLSDIISIEQPLDEKGDEQQKPENDKQEAEVSSKDQGNDEVDHCSTAIISTPAIALDLPAEGNICDLFSNEKREQNIFANEEREQNISEFTVIKSIINGDEKQRQESETKENPGDCDISLDSKLLCIDSSDCGIYAEDRCPLTQISEHDFTEEDSMVPMEWETSQIQEDAVNRLCSIDETSIDFTGAASSLQEANSLLNNLSLSRTSITKESRVSETIAEIASKQNDESEVSAVESAPMIEEIKATSTSNEENKEQDQVSSSSYEKMAYLRTTDCNANTKIVPKLVIKKSEVSSKFVTKMSSSSVTQLDSTINKSIFKPGCQPKIPKMIIRNARSRPGTPSIEAVHEEVPPVQVNISDRTLLTNEELYANDSEDSLQDSNNYRNKIPKMKIKLDEKHSNKIVRTEDTEVCIKRKSIKKTVPKVKIKSSSRNDLSDNSVCSNIISQESKDTERYEEKIPVLKLRKQERNKSPSPEVTRKRQSSCHPEVPLKKYKKSGRDEIGHSTRRSNSSDSMRTVAPDCETRKNPSVRISEKIPKVIIKRTSASAEFKCELSKSCKNVIAKSAKWQPEVKLERYRILDSMVKDLKLTLSSISLRTIDEIFSNRKDGGHCREKESDYKLSRSNSTSDLLPVKCKQRRMSDYDCRKTNDTLSFSPSRNSRDAKAYSTPKKNRGSKSTEFQKDNKRRSRSRDNKPRVEIDVTLSDKEINQTFERSSSEITLQCHEHKSDSFVFNREQVKKADEDTMFSSKLEKKSISIKHLNDSTDFKLALKELKTTSKMETCFVKMPDLNESFSEKVNLRTDKEQKEQDDDVFLDKDDNKIVIKKERLSNSDDVDNNCTLQDDVGSLKDDPANMLDNFEMDNNSVIKIESSDESQSTIEILPASPNGTSELESHMIEDGDSEQLYSADAIPTQFELELEITDNSNPDLLDVLMPRLDPITGYSSRRVSIEESCGDQTLKITRCNNLETSSRNKSLLEKNKHVMEIDISSDDRSVLENNSVGSIKEISSRSLCSKAIASTVTRDNFCCNDSLIKEVLAAKETLKKCLSKSRCESQNNARPKTAAEKKQGSSFDLNSLSETYSSDASSQGCNDITSQKGSIPAPNRSNKTENIPNAEKSDKKHSKQGKNSFVKRKMKSPKDNDKADTKETMEDTHECTTISLKAFKRFSEATSNESLIRTIYLNEERKKNLMERSDSVQLQDPQRREENKLASYKIPKISKSMDQKSDMNSNTKEINIKEDNMPILEPEITVNFDASSDRDSSRSPPVITIQDNEDLDITESKLMDDKVIMSSDKIKDDTKDINKKSEMSVADFITQLAYHEKATIKHRRYCNLCERWFPTTSRHRRHLAGYQHRHIELTQRRSIHALFMLFTGKPCPRLLPANVARNDCSVGELTPLQIAVQDVTKSFDCAQQSPRKQNDVDT